MIDYSELLNGYNEMVRNDRIKKIGGYEKHHEEFKTELEMWKTLYSDSSGVFLFGISLHENLCAKFGVE